VGHDTSFPSICAPSNISLRIVRYDLTTANSYWQARKDYWKKAQADILAISSKDPAATLSSKADTWIISQYKLGCIEKN
jgi:hypothetical protein